MAKLEPHPLMRTIVDHPDLDAPRLVYADWLDEQGDPKLAMLAEYIRLSVEWYRIERGAGPWRDDVRQRVAELETDHRDELLPPLPKWARPNVRCERGLPSYFGCTYTQFTSGGRVLELAPITSLSLSVQSVDSTGPFSRRELVRVQTLALFGTLNYDSIYGLWVCPHLTNLRELVLQEFALEDEWAEIFADTASHFPSLTKIRVYADFVTPDMRSALLRGFSERLWINDQQA